MNSSITDLPAHMQFALDTLGTQLANNGESNARSVQTVVAITHLMPGLNLAGIEDVMAQLELLKEKLTDGTVANRYAPGDILWVQWDDGYVYPVMLLELRGEKGDDPFIAYFNEDGTIDYYVIDSAKIIHHYTPTGNCRRNLDDFKVSVVLNSNDLEEDVETIYNFDAALAMLVNLDIGLAQATLPV